MAQKYELEVSDKLNRWGYAKHRFAPGLYIIEDDKLVAAAKRVVFGVVVRPITDDEAKERETVLYEASADARGGKGYECRYKELAERGVPGFSCSMWPLGKAATRDSHELRAHGQVFDLRDFPEPEPEVPEELGELVKDNSKGEADNDGAEESTATASETGSDAAAETVVPEDDADDADAGNGDGDDAEAESGADTFSEREAAEDNDKGDQTTGAMTTDDLPKASKKKGKSGRRRSRRAGS